ncbi:hypothetical protein P168DRAFT_274372 [Aspergillus campestris IBT 28561]|uniref:FHF complex subunit HOOK-interacting protein C-terminal domain-containing protein n=1 Tax=Aspergillus campestris (strain IBT 28561) TaxID=1392248 RepID=A0A2I1CVV4_ASPC2|nr:uncharacterized protein P168DRAFT_274372 [Aspergillus campestris IBT 28561]PKY01750.1 hypothetical protein P168DRAFT_274372 [Aspergillus campestris IBT 28561]
MDFWSRLIGGSRSLSNKSFKATTPTERLTAFKRTCNTLQQIWRSNNAPSGDQTVATHTRNCIDRLNSVLGDESRGPAPHPCLAYASSSQIFVTVTKLSLSSYDDTVLRSATVLFNTLIDAEVDGVVDNRLFARALVDLVRRADKRSEDVECRLVELLFGVANNIRLQPHILSAWFAPRSDEEEREPRTSVGAEFAGAMRKDDFPLFYLLVEYVHHAGRAGDFARTGLLYLIETASRSKDLERWLIESDLATLMATGLGALYSQLGGLSFEIRPEERIPHIVALSDHARQETALPPTLGSTMASFMAYLLFWQDTIDHCKSGEVNATLLDHFQVLFLEQLLYPSLLESSDVEGGSTAAVLTYLYRILDSIEQDDLVHRILHFLLASPSGFETKSAQKSVDMSMSRRKSLDVLAAFSEEAARPSPSLFNLRDLALLGLQSKNRQTVLATLRLMAVVLQRHHTFARSLIRTLPGQPAEQRTVGALNAELSQLVTLATSVVDDPMLEESFEDYLKDASLILESRLCIPADDDLGEDQPLEIRQDDPICQELLNCLEEFFSNSVIVNLALTEVLMSVASSHLLSLDGWLLVDPSKYDYSDSPLPEDANVMEQIQFAYTEPSWSSDNTPTLTSVLQKLVQQIQQWRKEVPDFDILIAARRDLLHNEDDPTSPTSQQASGIQSPAGGASERPRPNIDSIGSPRGRTPRPLEAHSMSPSPHRTAVASPLRDASLHMPPSRDSESQTSAADELRKRLFQPFIHGEESAKDADKGESTASGEQEEGESAVADSEPSSATLGHVLTNVVILYEFILEISAMVQARGTLFEEAGYPGVMSEQ